MEVYTLTIELLFGRTDTEWKRVVEFTSDTKLVDIHDFIFDTIGFWEEHLFEFYTGTSYRNKKRVFSDDDDFLDEEPGSLETTLAEIYPLGRDKLYYMFDWGDSWTFEIRRANKRKNAEPGVAYPRIIESVGENPDQYPVED